eukprot:14066056-Heterocapsa_arctica.AAC.1
MGPWVRQALSTIHGNLTQLDLTRKSSKRSHLPTNGKQYEAFQRLTNCGNYVKYNILKIFAGGIADSKRTRFLCNKHLPDEKGCWLCATLGCAMKPQTYPWGMEGPSICIQHWNHMIDKTREKSPDLPEWVIPWAWRG